MNLDLGLIKHKHSYVNILCVYVLLKSKLKKMGANVGASGPGVRVGRKCFPAT